MEGPLSSAPDTGGQAWSAEQLGDADGELVAVFIHGGFWRARFGAETIAPLARSCAALPGWAVWNLEYPRVGMKGGGWPGTALSVREAVQAAAQTAGGRPLALVGHSAGGHLALLAARSTPVALVVSLAGVCDLQTAAEERIGEDAVAQFLGCRPDEDPARYAQASPSQQLPVGSPLVLIHGDADQRVPVEQSRVFAAAARVAGDECELCELAGADHFELVDPRGRAWPIVQERLQGLGP